MAKRGKVKTYQLSEKGIKRLVSDLEAYKQELLRRSQLLVEELAKVGIKEAEQRIANAKGEHVDKSHSFISDLRYTGNTVVMDITLTGNDVIFIEFGAGIHYNGGASRIDHSPHPKGEELGYVIGRYPKGREGYSLGAHDSWHYRGDVVHGTEATMPMLGLVNKAREAEEIAKACKKVFGR